MRASGAAGREGREPGRGEAGSGDQEARERRPADGRGVEHREVEVERGGELGGGDEPRDEGLSGGVVERGGRGEQRVSAVEHGEALVAGEGQDREGHRSGQHGRLGGEHDPPAVEAVGRDSSPQREEDDRHDPGEAEGAQREGRAREQVDVPVEGHRLHLGARLRDELRQPEEPEVAVPQDAVRWAHSNELRAKRDSLPRSGRGFEGVRHGTPSLKSGTRRSASRGWGR